MTTFSMHATYLAAVYLLGAVPFGFLIARARGVDIRRVGSGNIGATNVFRAVGRFWGIATLLLDALKGVAAVVWLPRAWPVPSDGIDRLPLPLVLAGAALVIAGHNWPVFLRFKGGKGVATSLGVLLGLAPTACLAGLAVWLLVLLMSRYVSLASILAALTVAVLVWPLYLQDKGALLPGVLTLFAVLAIGRHHANIRRLLEGTEHRFGRSG